MLLLQGAPGDVSKWGHEYIRHLAGELGRSQGSCGMAWRATARRGMGWGDVGRPCKPAFLLEHRAARALGPLGGSPTRVLLPCTSRAP